MPHARYAQIRTCLGGNHPQAIANRTLQLVQIEPATRQARNLGIVLNDIHAQALMRHQRKLGIGKPATAQHEHAVDAMTTGITHCVLGLKHIVKCAIVRKDRLRPAIGSIARALVDTALHEHADLVAILVVHAPHTRQPVAGSRNLQTGSANSDGSRTQRRSSQGNAGNNASGNTRLVHLELLLQIKVMVAKTQMAVVLTRTNRADHVDARIARIPSNLACTFHE